MILAGHYIETEPGHYVDVELLHKPLDWQKRGLQYTASGYGHKIPTPFCVQWEGRLRRVYCAQFSNAGTTYIIVKGQSVIIH